MTRTAAVVALIVVACGETGCGGSSGDATMLDADTGPDAVATGPVRLTFSSPRQPAGGVPVIFLDVDDREVATVMTDASGWPRP